MVPVSQSSLISMQMAATRRSCEFGFGKMLMSLGLCTEAAGGLVLGVLREEIRVLQGLIQALERRAST